MFFFQIKKLFLEKTLPEPAVETRDTITAK